MNVCKAPNSCDFHLSRFHTSGRYLLTQEIQTQMKLGVSSEKKKSGEISRYF